jgi:glyoxylase-like metal-dependent hydrolase (beta-lactamase superfamily II)
VKIGAIDIEPVVDGELVSSTPATKPIPDAGSWIWQDQGGAFRHDGMRTSTLGGFLVRTGDRTVLVDAGAGPAIPGGYQPPRLDTDDPDDPLTSMLRTRGLPPDAIRQMAVELARIELSHGDLLGSLAALGVQPEDVTDIVLTHLHFDHIGWVSVNDTPSFPNATIRCAAADLDHFLAGPDDDRAAARIFGSLLAPKRLAPVLDRIETWATDGPLLTGLDVRLTPGHTPGSSVVVLSSGNERAMLLGDIIHCPLELMDDDFDFLGDHDQQLASQVRRAYARELEGTDIPVAAAHFPGLRFGRLLPSKSIRRFVFDA